MVILYKGSKWSDWQDLGDKLRNGLIKTITIEEDIDFYLKDGYVLKPEELNGKTLEVIHKKRGRKPKCQQ